MTPAQLMAHLTWVEVDGRYAPDCRRIIRDERMSLQVALRSGDALRIQRAAAEARRVAEMWGVEVQP